MLVPALQIDKAPMAVKPPRCRPGDIGCREQPAPFALYLRPGADAAASGYFLGQVVVMKRLTDLISGC